MSRSKYMGREGSETITRNPKLQEALRNGTKPVRYNGEDVEAARKLEEERGTSGTKQTLRAMKRDREEHEAIMNRERFGRHPMKTIQKRKGHIRNRVEERTINRINRRK